jgi:hypothetical protein
MIIIKAETDNEGRVIFPPNTTMPSGYISCHIDNVNFYFFYTQQEMDDFFNNQINE